MNFNKEFNAKGKWWLPENQNQIYFGELTYNLARGINLSIFGSLFRSQSLAKKNLKVAQVYGITESGKRVTLLDLFGHERGFNDFIESTFRCEYAVFSSSHLLTVDTDVFQTISANLNCNESFFHSLYKGIEFDGLDLDSDLHKMKFEKPISVELCNTGNVKTSLNFEYTYDLNPYKEYQFGFDQKVYITSSFQEALPFAKSIEFAKNLKSIFTFLSTKNIFFNKLHLTEKDSKQNFEVIFYQGNRVDTEKIDLTNLLISYKECEGEFEKMLTWFHENQNFVKNGLSLYLQLVNYKMESYAQQFLSIVFSLETLHTTFFDRKPFTDDEYKEFKKEKKSIKLSKVYEQRFAECLTGFNTLKFKLRILDLINLNIDLVKDYIYDANDFIDKLHSQRNYFAHQHFGDEEENIKEEDFPYFIVMCKLIYDGCFLKLVGISENNIKSIIESNYIYSFYKKKKPNPPQSV